MVCVMAGANLTQAALEPIQFAQRSSNVLIILLGLDLTMHHPKGKREKEKKKKKKISLFHNFLSLFPKVASFCILQ